MQVLTNEQLVASKGQIGKFGTLLGIVAMVGGFFTSLNIELIAVSYGLLIFGLLAFNIGRYHSLRWGGRPRQDEVLASALKGLDHKYVLFNYADGLPASHLLLSPLGLFLIETRIHDGEIKNEGDRWHRKKTFATITRGFVEGSLGNPTKDALQSVDAVKSFVAEKLEGGLAEGVPVEAVITFMSPRVELEVSEPVVPVLTPKDLKAHVRSVQGRTKMPAELYRRLYELLGANRAKPAGAENDSRERRKR